MKFKVYIGGGIGHKEVEAEEIDGAYVAAVEQFGCRVDDILSVMPCAMMRELREYREQVGGGKVQAMELAAHQPQLAKVRPASRKK